MGPILYSLPGASQLHTCRGWGCSLGKHHPETMAEWHRRGTWAVLGVHGAPGTPTGSRPSLCYIHSERLAPQAQAPHRNPGHHILPEEEAVPMGGLSMLHGGVMTGRGVTVTGPVCPVLPRHAGGHALGTPEVFSDQAEHSDLDLGELWEGSNGAASQEGRWGS